jgi:hypothetical protein
VEWPFHFDHNIITFAAPATVAITPFSARHDESLGVALV